MNFTFKLELYFPIINFDLGTNFDQSNSKSENLFV